MAAAPTTLAGLFEFYSTYAKLLYSAVQAENVLPVETLFELNAALDHISRHWVYQESEEEVVARAYAHLKRSCLDIFKIQLRKATDQYHELIGTDISIIDNGQFQSSLIKLHNAIRREATEARRFEGMNTNSENGVDECFARWEPVYRKCIDLEKEYYMHPAVDWARRKSRAFTWKSIALALATGFLSGILSGWFLQAHILAPR